VAADSYSLRFLDLSIDKVPYLEIAEIRGLGVRDWKSLPILEIVV